MERRRRLGRGLDDISHYFISQDQEHENPEPLFVQKKTKCQIISIVDLFNPHRGALITSALSMELRKHDIRTLIIDTDHRFPGMAHTLGLSVPGLKVRHYVRNQYDTSDLVYDSRSGHKILAPRLSEQEVFHMKRSEMSLMFETLTSIEQCIDVIIQRQYESVFRQLIEDAVFMVPANHSGMIRAYREIKLFVSGLDRKTVGIVITDAVDEETAGKAFEKISKTISESCGIKPVFCGHFSDISTFSVSEMAHYVDRVMVTYRETANRRRLFFESIRYLIGLDNVSNDEIRSLQ